MSKQNYRINDWYSRYTQEFKPTVKIARNKESEYSWIRFDISKTSDIGKVHKKIQNEIDNDDLYVTEPDEFGWAYGLETDPHVTVLYGIHDDSTDIFKECVSKMNKFDVSISNISIFEKEKYDVLKIEVESEELRKIHKTLKEKIENTQSFPEYNPHITIAYIKKGEAKKYARKTEKQVDTVSELIFQDRNNKNTKISL